jgi:tRNA pseudouridine38-40 synthase
LKNTTSIMGSSRTDAGVHARQQIAHFDVEDEITNLPNLSYRLNKILPSDIAIKRIYKVEDNYHCRFEAISRKYEYHISTQKNPFQRGLYYEFANKLNIDLMNKACQTLFKHIDFECFSKIKTDVNTFNCTISEAYWQQEEDDLIVFYIKANRFLRGMVRAIVGTLLDVGLGKLSIDDFEQIILSKNRRNAGRAVPAEGLFLMEVNY